MSEPEFYAGEDPIDPSDPQETLRRELAEAAGRHLRLRADFENYRRRASRELEAARRDGRARAVLALLPVLDSLERGLAAGSTDPEFLEGVASTARLFHEALKEAGVTPIPSAGRPFDPRRHEALATEPAHESPPGTVLHEVRRGFELDGEVLRPAQVVVAADEPDSTASV
jgi:molecular chaperone GrpE